MSAPLLSQLMQPLTVRELVRCADSVPAQEVADLIPEIADALNKLVEEDGNRAVYVRHLIVLGALVNRAIFEVCAVPKDADAVI